MRALCCIFLIVIPGLLKGQNEVIHIWSGAITSNSAKVNAKMTDTSSTIRLVADEDSTFASPLLSPYYSVDTSTNYVVAMEISGLDPATRYFYCIESGGVMDTSANDVGSFKTFGNGAYSFSFVTGSCVLNSDHPSYQKMADMDPDFYINTGDLHYANPNSATDIYVHRSPYETQVLSKPRAAALFKKVPIVYIWDDHDFCSNGSDSSFAGKLNARRAYHEYVPHYPLALGSPPSAPISQAFTVGRIRFIMTDLRSGRSPVSMFSNEQVFWFENELITARDNNQIIAWINPATWNNITEISDNWGYGNYSSDRTYWGYFFNDNLIRNMFMICGDAHMLAIDDGTNGNFSGSLTPFLYPVFQAAAVNQDGSYKGGIYNQGGYFPNPDYTWGQFGRVLVNDNGGDSICITFEGYRVDSSGTDFSMLNSYTFCRELTTIGIEEKKEKEDVRIQPNPAGYLNIVFSKQTLLKGVNVYDSNGRSVHSNEKIGKRLTVYEPPLNTLPPGVYFVDIETEKAKTRKIWIRK